MPQIGPVRRYGSRFRSARRLGNGDGGGGVGDEFTPFYYSGPDIAPGAPPEWEGAGDFVADDHGPGALNPPPMTVPDFPSDTAVGQGTVIARSDPRGVLHQIAQATERNPDGSLTYDDGWTEYPDGSWIGGPGGTLVLSNGKVIDMADGTLTLPDGQVIRGDTPTDDGGTTGRRIAADLAEALVRSTPDLLRGTAEIIRAAAGREREGHYVPPGWRADPRRPGVYIAPDGRTYRRDAKTGRMIPWSPPASTGGFAARGKGGLVVAGLAVAAALFAFRRKKA